VIRWSGKGEKEMLQELKKLVVSGSMMSDHNLLSSQEAF